MSHPNTGARAPAKHVYFGRVSLVALAAAFSLASPALAQDASEDDAIIVTGSRIARPNLEQPTPVSTISEAEIQNAGTSNLGDVLAQLPALSFSGTVRANSDSFGDAGGLNFPDLRDLGTSRTLTLVDGLRHVAGDAGDSAVDLNSIPPALVERVEVVTGGASAIYGSDAVSGVINIITRRDFDGVAGDIMYSQPTNGNYNQNVSGNLTFGRNFMDDRANVTLSLFYDRTTETRLKSLNTSGRDYGGVDFSPGPDGLPDTFIVPWILSEVIDENSVMTDENGTPLVGFLPDGTPVIQPGRIGDNSFAFGQFAGPCDTCFSVDDWVLINPEVERRGIAGSFDFEFNPNLRFHFDGKYVNTEIADYVQPAFSFFEVALEPDNAFITPEIQAVLDANPTSIPLINRFFGDIGGRRNDITRETWRVVAGLEGDWSTNFADINWNLDYVRGETQNELRSHGDRIPGNYFAAFDAVLDPSDNTIKCRIDVPTAPAPIFNSPADPSIMTPEQCVPYNPFGQQNTQAAIDYLTYDGLRTHTITQELVTGSLGFDTSKWLNLPGGPVDVAMGFEYREETSENISDEFMKSGLAETSVNPDAVGGFDVTEFFVETHLPLLKDRPFFNELSIDLAARYADYSHVGEATAYRVGGVWGPVETFRFRGTYAKATRAPNITEAFLPLSGTFVTVTDPCDETEVLNNPNRAANCLALGITQPFLSNTNASPPGSLSGNSGLDSEESTSWTLGFIYEPSWAENLAFTVDYFNIEIEDAITLPDPQDIVDNCVDGPALDPTYCGLVTRDPTNDNNISFVERTYLNSSRLKTAGFDFTVAYRTNIADWTASNPAFSQFNGDLSVALTATYVENLRRFPFQTDPTLQTVDDGVIGTPRVKLSGRIAYEQGAWTFGWEPRFLSRSVRYSRDAGELGAEAQSPSQAEATWFHDFNAQVQIGDNWQMYGGVNNAFGEGPPLGSLNSAYDIYGRVVFIGARANF